jgi:predicted phosphodiesterase
MKLLTVSDKEVSRIYSPQIKRRFSDVDLTISSGDLSYYYLEYIISTLDIPLYYVRGNHAKAIEYRSGPQNGIADGRDRRLTGL